jgi:hypothetical protein
VNVVVADVLAIVRECLAGELNHRCVNLHDISARLDFGVADLQLDSAALGMGLGMRVGKSPAGKNGVGTPPASTRTRPLAASTSVMVASRIAFAWRRSSSSSR